MKVMNWSEKRIEVKSEEDVYPYSPFVRLSGYNEYSDTVRTESRDSLKPQGRLKQ